MVAATNRGCGDKVEISFADDIAEFERSLTDVQRNQVPFALALALTNTARHDVKPAIEQRIETAFDRPTPFTKRGVAYRPAKKNAPVATVFIKDVQAGYLEIEEFGGVRLPAKRAIPIPARGQVNKYGNLPRGRVQRLLAQPNTFSGRVKGRAGIWKRTKKGVKLLVSWEDRATYRPRFAFFETARQAAVTHFPRQFEMAWNRAIATARRPVREFGSVTDVGSF